MLIDPSENLANLFFPRPVRKNFHAIADVFSKALQFVEFFLPLELQVVGLFVKEKSIGKLSIYTVLQIISLAQGQAPYESRRAQLTHRCHNVLSRENED